MVQRTVEFVEACYRWGFFFLSADAALLVYHLTLVWIAFARNDDQGELLDLNLMALHYVGNLLSIFELHTNIRKSFSCITEEHKRKSSACNPFQVETMNAFLFSLFTAYVDFVAILRGWTKMDDNYIFPVEYRVLTILLFFVSIISFVWCFVIWYNLGNDYHSFKEFFSIPAEVKELRDETLEEIKEKPPPAAGSRRRLVL